MIEGERKFPPSFSFKPFVRLIVATNELPRLLDASDGLFRRVIILKFNRRFTDAEQDKGREGRLMAELSGN
jgi:putative DNA primase/helicase